MKKLTIMICVALVGLLSGASAKARLESKVAVQDAEKFTHTEAGVQFVLPKGWKAKPDGEVITVSSADEGLQVVFWVPDEDSFDAAVKALDKELEKTIKNVKITDKPTQDTHNGMAHFAQNGTGVVNGATIAWSVDVLGAKKPLIVLTFAAPDLIEKHADAYLQLVGSIKKIE